jgi:hypothetical protein
MGTMNIIRYINLRKYKNSKLVYYLNHLKAAFLFGDVIHIPETPSITKSRPINGNNTNLTLRKYFKQTGQL